MGATPVRRDDLLAHVLDDEIVLYDSAADVVHVLNPVTAQVWKLCDGQRTVAEIAAGLRVTDSNAPRLEIVQAALDELAAADLLQSRGGTPLRWSRRTLLRKMGVTAASMPAISSVLAPSPAAAGSGNRLADCGPAGAVCTADADCCEPLVCGPDGVCVDPADCAGQVCLDDSECCADHVCDSLSGTCQPTPAPEDCAGRVCLSDGDCCADHVCDSLSGTCQPMPVSAQATATAPPVSDPEALTDPTIQSGERPGWPQQLPAEPAGPSPAPSAPPASPAPPPPPASPAPPPPPASPAPSAPPASPAPSAPPASPAPPPPPASPAPSAPPAASAPPTAPPPTAPPPT